MAKTKYETEVLPRLKEIEVWASDGLIDKDIAGKLGIAYSTFREYVKKYSALSAALKKSKAVADKNVEDSLYRKTQGYNVPIKKTFKCKEVVYDKDTGKKIKEIEKLKEGMDEIHVPADTTAMIFWLNNRKPSEWGRNANKEKMDRKRFEHEKEIDKLKYF